MTWMILLAVYLIILVTLELYIFRDYLSGEEEMSDEDIIWHQKRIFGWPFVLCCFVLLIIMMLTEEFLMKHGWMKPSNCK
jgi:O-antigen/teichoic acid export membrane protein